MKKALEHIGYAIMFTGLLWLSYYPFNWVNKLGILLRGNMIDLSEDIHGVIVFQDWFDEWLYGISSLGVIFFSITIFTFIIWLDDSDKKDKE